MGNLTAAKKQRIVEKRKYQERLRIWAWEIVVEFNEIALPEDTLLSGMGVHRSAVNLADDIVGLAMDAQRSGLSSLMIGKIIYMGNNRPKEKAS